MPPSTQHGEGTKRFPDGSEHSGRWRAGNRDGPGVFIDARGQKTVGNFRDDAFGKAEEDGIVAPVRLGRRVDRNRFSHDAKEPTPREAIVCGKRLF